MRLRAAAVLLALIGAATAAGAETGAPVLAVPLPSPTVYVAPTPAPLAPPTNPGPAIAPPGRFIEVFLNAPLEVCEQRDSKGLYARARAGELKEFTGISAPYEEPLKPEIQLHTNALSVTECVTIILERLKKLLPAGP